MLSLSMENQWSATIRKLVRASAWPHKIWTQGFALLKKRYEALKNRYGPRYTHAMLAGAFFTLWLPVPGATLLTVAFIMGTAEAHRALAKRGGLAEAIADLLAVGKMNMPCWVGGRWPSSPCRTGHLELAQGRSSWRSNAM